MDTLLILDEYSLTFKEVSLYEIWMVDKVRSVFYLMSSCLILYLSSNTRLKVKNLIIRDQFSGIYKMPENTIF